LVPPPPRGLRPSLSLPPGGGAGGAPPPTPPNPPPRYATDLVGRTAKGVVSGSYQRPPPSHNLSGSYLWAVAMAITCQLCYVSTIATKFILAVFIFAGFIARI
jgi:hypothetical protein